MHTKILIIYLFHYRRDQTEGWHFTTELHQGPYFDNAAIILSLLMFKKNFSTAFVSSRVGITSHTRLSSPFNKYLTCASATFSVNEALCQRCTAYKGFVHLWAKDG